MGRDLEAAKDFGRGIASFYDEAEFALLLEQVGSMSHLRVAQTVDAVHHA
jgi:hypothetical protein